MEVTSSTILEQRRLAHNTSKRAWAHANAEKVRAAQQKYKDSHPDVVKESIKKQNARRLKADYKNGKVYALRSYLTSDIYIGSTTAELAYRFKGHKTMFSAYQGEKAHYMTSFQLLKFDDCFIELLEAFPCETKTELEKQEGKWQLKLKCVNAHIAGRSQSQYYVDNLSKIEEYRKLNKDKLVEYQTKRKVLCECACGNAYMQSNKARHMKSKKHLELMSAK